MTIDFTPSLLMALTDFIPVIFFIIGIVFLGKYMRRNANIFPFILFLLGAISSSFGGLAKASWKLLLAIWDYNIPWLDDFQFLFLASGFLLIFISLLTIVVANKKAKKDIFVAPALLTIKGTPIFAVLLSIVTLSTFGLIFCLVKLAKKLESKIAIVMYIIYLAVALAMGAFSGSGDSETVNWIAQSINTLGTLALLIGHYNLNKKDTEHTQNVQNAQSVAA